MGWSGRAPALNASAFGREVAAFSPLVGRKTTEHPGIGKLGSIHNVGAR